MDKQTQHLRSCGFHGEQVNRDMLFTRVEYRCRYTKQKDTLQEHSFYTVPLKSGGIGKAICAPNWNANGNFDHLVVNYYFVIII